VPATVVSVFGSSASQPGSPAYDAAYQLGRAIAQAGWTLCNGGYGGTMEAAARGAVEAGGHTIGVTCWIFGRGGPNAYIKQDIPTFDLMTRLNTLMRLGRAYVALPGGTGTLVEVALAWELLNKRLLRRRPCLVLLGEHWTPLIDVVRREQPDSLVPHVARDVAEAIVMLGRGVGHGADGTGGDELFEMPELDA
jgi:uncharacterized protein (TIGR00730 family)